LSAQVVFTEVTDEAGIALSEWLTESLAWGDYDGDGDEDLYLTVDGPNRLFRNEGGGRFTDVTEEAGVGNSGFGVGTAFGDLDNDGDLDLVVTADAGEPNRLWLYDGRTGHHWLGLRLRGTRSNRSADGARVAVTTAAGSFVQEVSGGAGRGSQNSLPLEFGLGAASVVGELTVRWPSGTVQKLRNVTVDRFLDLVEPATETRRGGGRRAPSGHQSSVSGISLPALSD
jgi:hypothetical protein